MWLIDWRFSLRLCAGPQSETNCGTHIVVGVDGVKAFREGKAVVGSNADRSDTQHVCIGTVAVVCACACASQ